MAVLAVGREQLVIDGLALNDGVDWVLRDLQVIPAKKKLNWVGSALSDGSAASGDEDHYENAEIIGKATLMQQPDMDTALSVLNQLTTKLQKARSIRGGLPAIWTPHDSSRSVTMYILNGEIENLPLGFEDGWWLNRPTVDFHLYSRPFLYGSEELASLGLSDSFVFDGLTNGTWRWDAGTGTGGIAFGVFFMSDTTTKRIYRPSTFTDCTVAMRFRTGTTITASSPAVNARRQTNSDRLTAVWTSNTLRLRKVVGGVNTDFVTSGTINLSSLTYYWLVGGFQGNDLSVSLYADADSLDTLGNPLMSLSYTLTGADATAFGNGIRGNPGFTITPASTDWQIHHFMVTDSPDIENADPMVSFEIEAPEGDVPAEGRQVVVEESTQTRSHYEWGLENRNYDLDLVTPHLIDSDALVTSGFAGAQTTSTGSYDPNASGNNAITASPLSSTVPVAVCGTGTQFHVGTFKVKARVTGADGTRCRLAWRVGNGAFARNTFSDVIAGAWREMDLGTIVIPEAGIGTQTWEGKIEAYGTNGSLTVDYVMLFPLERYGVARAPLQPIIPDSYAALDAFNQGSATVDATATLDIGPADGKWHTNGATGDFTINTTSHWMQRTQLGDAALNAGRYARAGTTNFAAVQVQADMATAAALPLDTDFTDKLRFGILLRYVDTNNWLMVVRQTRSTQSGIGISFDHRTRLRVYKRVAGTITQLGDFGEQTPPDVHRRLICSVDAAGVWQVYSYWTGQNQPAEPQLQGQDSVLATGQALQNGKIGLYDAYMDATNAATRTFDNFSAFAPTADAVLFANQTLEVRSDRTERQAAAGGDFYGSVPMYRGSRFYVPATGKTSRMAVKVRRADVDNPGLPDNNIADKQRVSVFVRPRWLVAPA